MNISKKAKNRHIKLILTLCFFLGGNYSKTSAQSAHNIYHFNKKNSDFNANIISDLCIDKNGKLYIATPSAIYKFNGFNFNKIVFTGNQRVINLRMSAEDSIIALLADGSLYSINENDQAYVYFKEPHRQSFDFNYVFTDGPKAFNHKIITQNEIRINYYLSKSVYLRGKNQYLICDQNHIFTLSPNLKPRIITEIKRNKFKRIILSNYRFYGLTENAFYDVVNPKIKLQLPNNFKPKSNYYFVQKGGQPALLLQEENVWYLNNTNLQNPKWELLTNKLPTEVVITSAAYSSKLDHWYLGTQTDGLFVLKPQRFNLFALNKQAPHSNFYFQIPIDPVHILTNNGYLIERNKFTAQKTELYKIYYNNNNLNIGNNNFILNTNEEHILYNTKQNNIKRLIQTKSVAYSNYLKWNEDSVLIIQQDSILILNPKTNKIRFWMKNGHSRLNIYPPLRVNNELWIPSCNGVKIINVYSKKAPKIIFPNNCVRALYPSKFGIWVSVYGTGVFLIHPKNYSIQKAPLDYRQSLLNAHSFYRNKTNQLLIPTNTGLLCIPEKILFKSLNKKYLIQQPLYMNEYDGIPSDEFNGGANPPYITFGDSLISYPTIKGLIQFNPNTYFKQNNGNIYLKITEIQRSGKPVLYSGNSIHLPTYTPEINLKFDVVFWKNPHNLPLYYSYKGKIQSVPYEKLNNLTLFLDHYGNEPIEFFTYQSNQKKSILLTLYVFRNPLWYTQYYYWMIIIITVWGLFYAYDAVRSYRLDFQNARLQNLVDKKTKELHEVNQTLQMQVEKLTQSNNANQFYISVINHDIFAPIKYINMIGNQLSINNKSHKKEDILNYINLIINTTKRLEILCSNILNHLNPNRIADTSNYQVNLFQLVIELREFLKIGLQFNKNQFIINIPENLEIRTNKDALNIILTNLVSNANRFTQNGIIQLNYFKDAHNNLHILEVMDTGKGITEDLIKSINQQNLKILNRNSIQYQSYGIGYNLIFKMLEVIQASLTIESNNPKGSKVVLKIPF